MTEQPVKLKAHLQVVLMFAIIIATLALGFFMMPGSEEERAQLISELGTTNHGEFLLPMKQVSELPLVDEAGNDWSWEEHKPKWRMLIPAGARCVDECGELLFTTRQVHILMGKFARRLERMILVTNDHLDSEFQQKLKTDHPFLKIAYTPEQSLVDWLADTDHPWQPGEGKVVLVDPAGRAMMVYTVKQSGNDMVEDLNHLLKYSAD